MSESEQAAKRHETRRPKFDGTINLGHVLTGASMLIGGIFVWTQSMVVQAKQDLRINVVERTLTEQSTAIRQLADTQQLALRNQDKLNLALEYFTQKKP